jgi:pilus assembly protein Flp/PilA
VNRAKWPLFEDGRVRYGAKKAFLKGIFSPRLSLSFNIGTLVCRLIELGLFEIGQIRPDRSRWPRLFAVEKGSPMGLLRDFIRNDSGATAIEYGLIAALIAVVIITGVTSVGTKLSTTFTTLSGKLN